MGNMQGLAPSKVIRNIRDALSSGVEYKKWEGVGCRRLGCRSPTLKSGPAHQKYSLLVRSREDVSNIYVYELIYMYMNILT